MIVYKRLESFFDTAAGACAGIFGFTLGKDGAAMWGFAFAWLICVMIAAYFCMKQRQQYGK